HLETRCRVFFHKLNRATAGEEGADDIHLQPRNLRQKRLEIRLRERQLEEIHERYTLLLEALLEALAGLDAGSIIPADPDTSFVPLLASRKANAVGGLPVGERSAINVA